LTDYKAIMKEFNISQFEVNNEFGIIGAVYNRISLKDLK